jgi:lipopolysaccharide/colanic/teichoic acid biosynthesis glycosyltransferase
MLLTSNPYGLQGKTVVVKDSYKRWFDLTVLLVAHVILAPIWLLVWTVVPILIWLEDKEQVFHRQQRMGRGGKPFNLLKFRTMVIGAEGMGPAWTTENDPRVTRVGKILRRTALDELPEIISIWKGDMSFVGPRALFVDEQLALEELMPGFEKRLQVRPGLTGLAQIHDRMDDPQEKFRYDMEYLQKLNPLLDTKLLLLSVWNTMRGRWDHRSGKTKLANLKPNVGESSVRQSKPAKSDKSKIRR